MLQTRPLKQLIATRRLVTLTPWGVIDGLEKDWANHLLGYHGVRSPSHIGGILMLFIASLAWLRSGVWPYYDLRMLWEELHLRQWNVQEIIDSALALVPTLPLWAAAAFVGGSMYIVGSVGYAVINAYIQLAQRASAAS
jgi:hypothetical protein